MKIKSGFVLREVGGDSVVVPVGERVKTFRGMINLNATGAFIWQFFASEHTQEECVDALCEKYCVSREQAERDVDKFVTAMRTGGFLE